MNTNDKNMATQEIISDLKAWIPLSPTLNQFLNQAADRLEELQLELTETREELDEAQCRVKHLMETGMHAVQERDRAIDKAKEAYKMRKEAEIERDSLRDTMALNILELTQQRDEARAEAEWAIAVAEALIATAKEAK